MAKKISARSEKSKPSNEQVETIVEEVKDAPIICGLVMPISEIDGCSAEHWMQVRDIIEEALSSIDIETSLVSDGDEVGIIQERIVQNLYDRPIVVCDVSCKNPNVMFELGLRLAFDMPTVVIKDNRTNYSFDTSPLEHLSYPRDLNYWSIQDFKETLAQKVSATLKKKNENPDYSPFLKAFNKKRVADIETTEITSTQFLMDQLEEIKQNLDRLYGYETSLIKRAIGTRYSKKKSEEGKKMYVIKVGDSLMSKPEQEIAQMASEQNEPVYFTSDGIAQIGGSLSDFTNVIKYTERIPTTTSTTQSNEPK